MAEPETIKAARKAKSRNPKIRSIIMVGEPHEGCHTFKEMANCDPSGVTFMRGADIDTVNDVAILPFSSGTTGNFLTVQIKIFSRNK